ncbi:MAG: hypothetical protein ACKO4K_06160, partial [Flavobacteriales bacterium]
MKNLTTLLFAVFLPCLSVHAQQFSNGTPLVPPLGQPIAEERGTLWVELENQRTLTSAQYRDAKGNT